MTLRAAAAVAVAFAGCSLVPATLAAQDDCSVPPELTLSRPDSEGVPTEITVGAYLLDLHEIKDTEQAFSADIFFAMSWLDERLLSVDGRSLAGCSLPLESVWAPRLAVVNEREVSRGLPDVVLVDTTGSVEYQQRFRGSFVSRLHLRDFPLDSQELAIHFLLGRTEPEAVTFVHDERTGQSDNLSIADWTVGEGRLDYEPFHFEPVNQYIPQVSFKLNVTRNRSYFFQKVFIPLILIVSMSWAVFWIDPKLVPPQIGISTSAVLTLIAFLFSLAYTLPRLPYLTRADRFVMGATVLVFIAFGEALVTTSLAGRDQRDLAVRIDRTSRIAFPTAFAGILLYSLVI